MNARAEACERLGEGFVARVLEPSPPAVNLPPWFADDPAARGDALPGRTVVSPVGVGDLSWDELAVTDPKLAEVVIFPGAAESQRRGRIVRRARRTLPQD